MIDEQRHRHSEDRYRVRNFYRMLWDRIKSWVTAGGRGAGSPGRQIRYTVVRGDGFGSQYQGMMSGVAYARYMNYQYVHTPFRRLDHGTDVAAMNRFIGIPVTGQRADIREEGAALVNGSDTPDLYYTEEVRSLIRGWYFSTDKPRVNPEQIAIHIRRGDAARQNLTFRLTSNAFYRRLILDLKAEYPDLPIMIHSEGEPADFSDLEFENVELALNQDLQLTFHSLVMARVLVTAKSSLSYAAALLNQNTVYYIPFWHKPLKCWKICEENE